MNRKLSLLGLWSFFWRGWFIALNFAVALLLVWASAAGLLAALLFLLDWAWSTPAHPPEYVSFFQAVKFSFGAVPLVLLVIYGLILSESGGTGAAKTAGRVNLGDRPIVDITPTRPRLTFEAKKLSQRPGLRGDR
jgi:hypothetical protein